MAENNLDPVISIEQGEYESPIGALSDNVYIVIDGNVVCTLTDFYREWTLFRDNAKFLQYKHDEPISPQVKLWYDIFTNEVTDVSYPTGDNSDPDAPQSNNNFAENEDYPQENNG